MKLFSRCPPAQFKKKYSNKNKNKKLIMKKWPGETEEAHPEIFNKIPKQPDIVKEGQLPFEKVQQFFNQGYLQLNSFFSAEELNPCKESINQSVDSIARKLYDAGKIKDLHDDLGFENRLTKLEEGFPGSCILAHKIGELPESFARVWSNERLLNVVEQLLGTANISGHPVWNLRTKIPNCNSVTVPWHQDSGYLDNDSYKLLIITAWIPLIDTNKEIGCLNIVKYGHKTGKVAKHTGCWKDTWYIMLDEKEIEQTLKCDMSKDVVMCEVPFGGVLLFSNLLPHQSLSNTSDRIRWSLDFRWHESERPNGFCNIMESVQMKSSDDSSFNINWDKFNCSRHEKTNTVLNKVETDQFDTTITGPWMRNWELVNKNRHTEAMEKISSNIDQ